MFQGFIRIAAATPKIKVADCNYNANKIIELIGKANHKKVKVLALPELCITAYTCGDLFFQQTLLDGAMEALNKIVNSTIDIDMLVFVGLPVRHKDKLFNCAVAIHDGTILGFVPKTYIPNHSEFYEKRYFVNSLVENSIYNFNGKDYPFGTNIIFSNKNIPNLKVSAEICEDLWAPISKSTEHALAGATLICNLSASDETVGKSDYRLQLIKNQSAKTFCGYIYSDAGEGESSTDMVFGSHNIIAENGTILAQSDLFANDMVISEIDVDRIEFERNHSTSFSTNDDTNYIKVNFEFSDVCCTTLTRTFNKHPFIPNNNSEKENVCENILQIQSEGLKKRISHTSSKKIVIGVSGGLDSSLALIVAARTMKKLNKPANDILAVTMPCFGTTDRTYNNAVALMECLGVSFKEVNIKKSVLQNFSDIGHDPSVADVTYENVQARIRTLVLMNTANEVGGIVLGTGDLSESALGWATYAGDHISMYNVNASVPKTLIRHIIQHEANNMTDKKLSAILNDILDTPVSPELLPSNGNDISQKTEDLVGPYELHDFFLYYMVRLAFPPKKIYRIAKYTFDGLYDDKTILKWLKVFYKRFFSQQFKRSCMPDAPKIGSVSLSPRADWRMPSDACNILWLEQIENM